MKFTSDYIFEENKIMIRISNLDVVGTMVVAVSFHQNNETPIQIALDGVHLKWLADENQPTDNLFVAMKAASPLLSHQSTSVYYTIYSQVALIPEKAIEAVGERISDIKLTVIFLPVHRILAPKRFQLIFGVSICLALHFVTVYVSSTPYKLRHNMLYSRK